MSPALKKSLQKEFQNEQAWNQFIESAQEVIEESILKDEFKTDCSHMTLEKLEKYKESETFGTIIQKELELRAHRKMIMSAVEESLYSNTKSTLGKDIVFKNYWFKITDFLGERYEGSYINENVSIYYEFCPRERLYGKRWVRLDEVDFYATIWLWGMKNRYMPWWEKHIEFIISKNLLNAFASYIGYYTNNVIDELLDVKEYDLVTQIFHKVAEKYKIMSDGINKKAYSPYKYTGVLYWCKCCIVMLKYASKYPNYFHMKTTQILDIFKNGCTKICIKMTNDECKSVCSGHDYFHGDIEIPDDVKVIINDLYS